VSTPQPNRSITDLRAKLRLGGPIAAEAIQLVVDTWKTQGDLGKTAAALGLSRRTFERARADFPALSAALGAAQAAVDVFKG
jgi:hypothetical protein